MKLVMTETQTVKTAALQLAKLKLGTLAQVFLQNAPLFVKTRIVLNVQALIQLV